jgi:uncharacterized repeat protein (TIGR02543 family)
MELAFPNNGTFLGWFTAPTGGTNITTGIPVSARGNYRIYARWS